MRKLYSLVLMVAALLIGTNAWAVSSWSELKTALEAGGLVQLSGDINETYDANTFQSILIGAKNSAGTALAVDGAAPADAILDLNGHNITITANSAVAINAFVLTKGFLKITGTGTIEVTGGSGTASGTVYKEGSTTETETITYPTGYPTNSTNVFFVFGADEANKVNPLTAPFSHLFIDENVTITTKNGTVIAVDQLTVKHAALAKTNMANKGYATSGKAYGALVEVKGKLTSQGADYYYIDKKVLKDGRKCYGIKTNGNLGLPDEADKMYAPYVHVYPSAVLTSDMRSGLSGSAAAYASGYAQWLIEGTCNGATGAYISAGTVNINNAMISSAAPTYEQPGNGGHANGSGSAIVINSRDRYPGEIELTVSGDTKASATSGFAVQEIVSANESNTKVDEIIIEGGSFVGGAEGALTVSQATATEAEVVVAGGDVTGAANVGTEELAEFLNEQGGTHATVITDGTTTTLVISQGDAPDPAASIEDAETTSVKLQATKDTIQAGDTIVLDELQMIENVAQTLVVEDGAILSVGRVVLDADAQIIVEAGAKFIVTGEQGIYAPAVDNIILRNEDGKRSIFLFNPAVTSNKHPNAKVELITNSWRIDSERLQWECFGLPTFGEISGIASVGAASYVAVWENGGWTSVGIIGTTGFDESKLNKPFAAYNLLANRAPNVAAPKITIDGQLVGNVNGDLNANYRWTPFANSYTAELDLEALLTNLGGAQYIAQGVWVAQLNGSSTWTWETVDLQAIIEGEDGAITKIAPMQAFLLNNPGSFSEVRALDYASMVYAPATAAPAPKQNARRSTVSETTAKVRVIVANEQGVVDKVMLRENANNVYALEKYMNEDMNIYVMADEKSAIVNAEDMENTYVGFSTVNGGKFTISFANVEGREFTLIDHETGAQVAMVEGNTYEFTANGTNDYRFEIVNTFNAPTDIENTEAVKNVKGIYTVTGQYVGEMNVWNTLPAGIYVVNGEKLVK